MLGVLPYTPEEVAVPADAAGDASSVLVCSSATAPFCSSDVAFGAHGIEIGRPPRPDRVAEAVGITSKRASVQWQPGRTRIGRARSRRPGRPTTLTAGRTDPIHVYRNSSTGPFWTREAAQALPGRLYCISYCRYNRGGLSEDDRAANSRPTMVVPAFRPC